MYVDVILPLPLDGVFTYSVPSELERQVVVGCRVLVPFGRNKTYVGIVASTHGDCPPCEEGAQRPESPGRVLPAISIDTYRPEIVSRAYDIIGPFIVNDVGGGEPEMLRVVGELGLPYVAMHGCVPKGDVIEDILDFFRDFAARADDAGVKDWILDPGFGFGKDIGQNYEILRRLEELQKAGREILIGISRKSMIYKVLGTTPEEVMPQTLALEMIALQKGATWLRVHDVKETAAMVKVYSTMYTSSPGAAK